MALYKGGNLSLSPLKLQLTPASGGPSCTLVEWRAALQAEVGAQHTRPTLSRPSVLGTTSSKVGSERVDTFQTATAQVISQFATEPSLPATGAVMTYVIPGFVSYQWQAPAREGLIVYSGDALLLYALAGGGGAWDGEMSWEE